MERDVAIRMTVEPRRAGDVDPAESEGLARTEGMDVVADPGASERAPDEEGGSSVEVGWDRHLEVGGIAGHDMDGDSTSLEQGGLVGPRPVSRVGRGQCVAQERSTSAGGV